MTTDERTAWLGEQVQRALFAAVDRRPEHLADTLDAVAERYGPHGMFGVCYAFASIVQTLAFPGVQRGDGSLTGQMLAITRLPGATSDDPHSLWAARFVVAYVNGDADNTNALFYGSLEDDVDAHMGGTIALICMAADLARAKEAEPK